jgi:hypothetical protein
MGTGNSPRVCRSAGAVHISQPPPNYQASKGRSSTGSRRLIIGQPALFKILLSFTADAHLDFLSFQALPDLEGRNAQAAVLYLCSGGV